MRTLSIRSLLLAIALLAATPLFSQEKVAIDVKTKLLEKPALTAAKNGALLFLMESAWGTTAEWTEDYALWLRNCRREELGDSVTLTIDLELRAPSLFQEGELLATKTITATYNRTDDWKRLCPPDAAGTIEDVEEYGGYAALIAKAFYPKAMLAVQVALDELMPADLPQLKIEAMVVGASVVMNAREMVEEVRGEERVDEGVTATPGDNETSE